MEGGAPSSPSSWSEVVEARRRYLDSICELMREAVPVKDRRSFGISYKDCLDAKEIVAWLLAGGFCCSNKDAVEIGRALQKQKYIVHIWGSHTVLVPFSDSSMYFQFTDKGMLAKAAPASPSQAPLKRASMEMRRAASRIILDVPTQELELDEEVAGQAPAEEVDGETATPCTISAAASPCASSEAASLAESSAGVKDADVLVVADSRKDTDVMSGVGQTEPDAVEETSERTVQPTAPEPSRQGEDELPQGRRQEEQQEALEGEARPAAAPEPPRQGEGTPPRQRGELQEEEEEAVSRPPSQRATRKKTICEWTICDSALQQVAQTEEPAASQVGDEGRERFPSSFSASSEVDAPPPPVVAAAAAAKKKSVVIDLTGFRTDGS